MLRPVLLVMGRDASLNYNCMPILILSTAANQHASAVQRQLDLLGKQIIRLDFTSKNSRYIAASDGNGGSLTLNGTAYSWQDITSVFVHHPLPAALHNSGNDVLDSQLRLAGWRNTLDWIETGASHAVWLNKPSQSRRASSTAVQLQVAAKHGLRVPSTLFSNDLTSVVDFTARHSSIVLKPGPLPGVQPSGFRILTRVIQPNLLMAEDLECSPCIFQEYIEKAYELRVHVINGDVHTCKIESQRSPTTRIDWRNYNLSETPHFATSIECGVADACRAITATLGLSFGIIDMIVTPSGEYVFLECNSQGHWLWIEELTRLPITEAVARALVV